MFATVIVAGLAASVIYIAQNPNWGTPTDPRDERAVTLVARVDKGLAQVQYGTGEGMKTETFGMKSQTNYAPPGTWARQLFNVKPGTHITLIVTAEEVTAAHCGIRGPGIINEPPAITPLDAVSATVQCTATVG